MPQRCRVCDHPLKREIESAVVTGGANRRIATHFSLTESALRRHVANHLKPSVAEYAAAQDAARADDLLAQLRFLQTKALALLAEAESEGDLRAALQAIAQARSGLEFLFKVGDVEERLEALEAALNLTGGPPDGPVRPAQPSRNGGRAPHIA